MGCDLLAVTAWRVDADRMDEFESADDVVAHMASLQAQTITSALPADRAAAVERRVSRTVPAEALVDSSADAELVVIGPRSANVIDGLLLGSVAETVVSKAICPVVVVHDATLERSNRIVVGVDGTACSRQALDWALRQAALTSSRVEAIWAWQWRAEYGVYPYGPDDATLEARTKARLEAVLSSLDAEQAALVDGRVTPGPAARVLLDASAGADLLVVGNHRAGPLTERLLGSVSQKVVRHAQVPVVVVHESISDPAEM